MKCDETVDKKIYNMLKYKTSNRFYIWFASFLVNIEPIRYMR